MVDEQANSPCWQEIRASVFHAALRVKSLVQNGAQSTHIAELLRNELVRDSLAVKRMPCAAIAQDDWLINEMVFVRINRPDETQSVQEAELYLQLKKLGKSIGLLVDFNNNLVLDGMVTVIMNQANEEECP